MSSPNMAGSEDEEKHASTIPAADLDDAASADLSLGKGEIFSLQSIDPALNAKMHLVNNVRVARSTCRVSIDSSARLLMKLAGLATTTNYSS